MTESKFKQIGFFDSLDITVYTEETDYGPFYRAQIRVQEGSAKSFMGPHARSPRNAVKFALNQYCENFGNSENLGEI